MWKRIGIGFSVVAWIAVAVGIYLQLRSSFPRVLLGGIIVVWISAGFMAISFVSGREPGERRITKEEKPSYIKTVAIGLVMGVIGAIIGFVPIMFLHYQLTDFLVSRIFGSYGATPDVLVYLVAGFPMPFAGVIFVPIGGAIFGCIGSFIGLKRHSSRLWLWGGVAGFLFNFFASFWAQ